LDTPPGAARGDAVGYPVGLIVPVLLDADQAETRTGLSVIAASSVAEFGSVLLLSLLFSTSGGTVGERIASLLLFAAVVAAVAMAVFAASRSVRLGGVSLRLQDTTAELRVRAAALLIGFVVLAQRVGLETMRGAFVAWVCSHAVGPDTTTPPRFRAKLDGIGYGFVVPVFFITSGLQLDLHQLFASPLALLRVRCSWARFSPSGGYLHFSISGRLAFGRPRRQRCCRPLHCQS